MVLLWGFLTAPGVQQEKTLYVRIPKVVYAGNLSGILASVRKKYFIPRAVFYDPIA
jgi:hypothetical protein